jgi:hypothetical protein
VFPVTKELERRTDSLLAERAARARVKLPWFKSPYRSLLKAVRRLDPAELQDIKVLQTIRQVFIQMAYDSRLIYRKFPALHYSALSLRQEVGHMLMAAAGTRAAGMPINQMVVRVLSITRDNASLKRGVLDVFGQRTWYRTFKNAWWMRFILEQARERYLVLDVRRKRLLCAAPYTASILNEVARVRNELADPDYNRSHEIASLVFWELIRRGFEKEILGALKPAAQIPAVQCLLEQHRQSHIPPPVVNADQIWQERLRTARSQMNLSFGTKGTLLSRAGGGNPFRSADPTVPSILRPPPSPSPGRNPFRGARG